MTIDAFTRQYLETALWASCGDDGYPLDREFGIDHFATEAIARAEKDCRAFQERAADELCAYYVAGFDETDAAHDFFLTRGRHGAGFWSRGLGAAGDRLTSIAHAFGEATPYVGDDGALYL